MSGVPYLPAMETLETPQGPAALFRFGQGAERVLALHAFGQEGHSFSGLDLSPTAEVRAPDLPFHGATQWPADVPFRPGPFAAWLECLAGEEPFFLLGYSYGARLALAAQPYLNGLRGLLLVAPDGLATPGLRYLKYLPPMAQQAMQRSLRYTRFRKNAASLLCRSGLMGTIEERFLKKYVLPDEVWNRTTWPSWQALPQFSPSLEAMGASLRSEELPVWLALGKADRVVAGQKIRHWAEELPKVELHEYKGGHRAPWPQLAPVIRQWMLRV